MSLFKSCSGFFRSDRGGSLGSLQRGQNLAQSHLASLLKTRQSLRSDAHHGSNLFHEGILLHSGRAILGRISLRHIHALAYQLGADRSRSLAESLGILRDAFRALGIALARPIGCGQFGHLRIRVVNRLAHFSFPLFWFGPIPNRGDIIAIFSPMYSYEKLMFDLLTLGQDSCREFPAGMKFA